jgi:hypothetical protein
VVFNFFWRLRGEKIVSGTSEVDITGVRGSEGSVGVGPRDQRFGGCGIRGSQNLSGPRDPRKNGSVVLHRLLPLLRPTFLGALRRFLAFRQVSLKEISFFLSLYANCHGLLGYRFYGDHAHLDRRVLAARTFSFLEASRPRSLLGSPPHACPCAFLLPFPSLGLPVLSLGS